MIKNKVIIAGAGTMGASLSQVYALAGWNTVLHNRSEDGLKRAEALIALNQETLIKEGFLTEEQSRRAMSCISMTTDKACYADCALVLENIAENKDIKDTFWYEISRLVPNTAILCTNTSALPISELALSVHLPERFLGQHWLNPPHIIPLCEIILGEKTAPELAERMREIILGLGKKPVVIKDVPGFAVNRLQFALMREALHLVESGVTGVEDIDSVLKYGLAPRWAALGAFGTADFGGVDVFAKVNAYLNTKLCNDTEPSALFTDTVAEGKYGVKNGAGFYDYSGDKATEAIKKRDEVIMALAKLLFT